MKTPKQRIVLQIVSEMTRFSPVSCTVRLESVNEKNHMKFNYTKTNPKRSSGEEFCAHIINRQIFSSRIKVLRYT